jgi:ABC-type Mn2+/Zn2+ transport system permease subunit
MLDVLQAALIDPLAAPFMQTALVEMALLSLLVGVVGSYVVLRGQAFFTLALSHGIFPGIVLAFLLNWNYLIVSLTTGVIISVLIALVGRNRRVGSDSAIAAIYTGTFALGIVLVSSVRTFRNLADILFGRVFGIGWDDIIITALTGGTVLVLMAVFRKELLLAAFDPTMARAMGLPVLIIELGFFGLMAVTVIMALPAVGNIQLVALMVTAPATARLLTGRLVPMMLVAGLVSLVGCTTGLYLAYHFSLAPGSSIVATLTALFLLVLFFSPKQGLLFQKLFSKKLLQTNGV